MNFMVMDIMFRMFMENDLFFVKDIYDYYIFYMIVVYFVYCVSIDELKNYIFVGDFVYWLFIIEIFEGVFCGFCYFVCFKF